MALLRVLRSALHLSLSAMSGNRAAIAGLKIVAVPPSQRHQWCIAVNSQESLGVTFSSTALACNPLTELLLGPLSLPHDTTAWVSGQATLLSLHLCRGLKKRGHCSSHGGPCWWCHELWRNANSIIRQTLQSSFCASFGMFATWEAAMVTLHDGILTSAAEMANDGATTHRT